jgi:hypothetical protein
MGQAKIRKKNGTYGQRKVVTPESPSKWYAEDVVEQLQLHREHCTDPKCDESAITISFEGKKLVPMLYSHNFNEVFLGEYGTGDKSIDYQPIIALQLANPEDIRAVFNPDGSVTCMMANCDHSNHHSEPIVLKMGCQFVHSKGWALGLEKDGTVTLRCKECGDYLRTPGIARSFKLVSRPKPEWPNIFCHEHGIEPAYAACRHVLSGAKPTVLLSPDKSLPGLALCNECENDEELDVNDKERVLCVCQSGLNRDLGGRLAELLKQADILKPDKPYEAEKPDRPEIAN